ncbi:MAG: rod shape-determining protein MreD [Spirochaetales bacterium]
MKNLWLYLFLLGCIILQSTLLNHIAIKGVRPDLVLLTVMYLAHRKGSLIGQTAGFAAGLLQDFLSIAPFGFNGFVFTLVGYFYGITKGTFFIDPIFIPMAMAAVATVLKGLFILLLSALFKIENLHFHFFSLSFLLEIGYNMLVVPFLFALYRLFRGNTPQSQWEGR